MSKVQITYSAPALFLSSDNWLQIRHELAAQFPLHDLVWKSALRPSSRTIDQLDVQFISLDDVNDDVGQPILPSSLLDKPLVNIYVVTCEDNDVYRLTVKKQIKDWHALVSQRKNQEWLVLLVLRSDAKSSGGFLKMKSNILDKIKSDFNTEKRDRCIQVTWSPNQDNLSTWAEVRAKISESLLSAFDSAVTQREEEVKKSESQRQMPGWSFSSFFLLKESLATSFADMLLLEDALLQYDELEAAFFQVTKERSTSWFGKVVDESQLDDATSILDVTRKPYAELLNDHKISVFDLRIYLLARQCDIMAKQNKYVNLARKVQTQLGALSRVLVDAQQLVPKFFTESWAYSAAMTTIKRCENASSNDEALVAELNTVTAELLEYASTQLTRIGISLGYLPNDGPFHVIQSLLSSQRSDTSINTPRDGSLHSAISREDVLKAMSGSEEFYELYYSVTHSVIDMYAKVSRRKFAIRQYGRLALLDRMRGRLEAANKSFKSLPGHYGPSKWATLETYMLLRYRDILNDISDSKDEVWAKACLNVLKGIVLTNACDQTMLAAPAEVYELVEALIHDVDQFTPATDEYLISVNHPMLSVRLLFESCRLDGATDGSYIDLVIHNLLPVTLHADRVETILEGSEAIQLRFSTDYVELGPGKTTVSLFCPTPSVGIHVYRSSRVVTGKLALEFVPPATTDLKLRNRSKELPTAILIPKDYGSVDFDVSLPDSVQFGKRGALNFTFHSGRNDIASAIFRIEAPPSVRLIIDETAIHSKESVSFEANNNSISIASLQAWHVLAMSVPYEGPSTGMVAFKIHVEYRSPERADRVRNVTFHRNIDVGLPIIVNVQDIFREKGLLSVFSISSKDHQRVRVYSANLRLDDGAASTVRISGSNAHRNSSYTATKEQPVNVMFRIEAPAPITEPCRLILSVQFKTEKEEIKDLIVGSLAEVVSGELTAPSTIRKLSDLIIEKLTRDDSWVEEYQQCSILRVPSITTEGSEDEALIDELRKKLLNVKVQRMWRTAEIPVELPFMNIVSTARIDLLNATQDTLDGINSHHRIYAGQPILAKISLKTSFHWGRSKDSYKMRFEVQDSKQDWLVSGRRRGEFTATDGYCFEETITLIPLHHGKVTMPQVQTTPLVDVDDGPPPSSECVQEHGATLVTVLPRGGRSTFMIEMPVE